MAGVSERTISRLENGEKVGKFSLQKIMNALNTTLEALEVMTDENNPQCEQNTIPSELNISYRISNGRELIRLIQNTDSYGYDYYNCITEEQVEVAQNFLTCVLDTIDIWSMLDLAERFSNENFLEEQIKNLERLDLWVFGNRKVNKNNWTTTVIEIYSKDNPLIQKAHLDASLITK